MARYIFSVCILFCGIVLYTSCENNGRLENEIHEKPAVDKPDTVYTLDYVKYLAGKKNSLAGLILDSIESNAKAAHYKKVPLHKILFMRAYIASRNLQPNLALSYLLKIYHMDEVQNDPEEYLAVTGLISNEYYVLNKIAESVKYQLLYMEKARAIGDMNRYALGKLNYWMCNWNESNESKAIFEIRDARKIMRENNSDSTKIIWSQEIESSVYMDTGDYQSAIKLYQQILSTYNNLTPEDRAGTEVESDNNLEFKKAQTCITLAMLYAYAGDKVAGEKYFSEWKKFHPEVKDVLSMQLYNTVLGYLKASGRYSEALDYSLNYEKIVSEGDSINNCVLSVKKQIGSIYGLLGDYNKAWRYETEATAINDSLHMRANYNSAVEMAAIYETTEKQNKIFEQEVIISRNRIFIYSLIGFLAAAVIIALLVWLNSRKVLNKNRSLFDKIDKLSHAKRELDNIRLALSEQNKDAVSADNEICKSLGVCMRDKKLYLDPDLTREMVAAELCTNKLYLSNAIKEIHSKTFGEYINGLRLEYAKDILMTDFDIKIEAVALMSGFSSVRTFYRLFNKTYNLTPTEFRTLASEQRKHH